MKNNKSDFDATVFQSIPKKSILFNRRQNIKELLVLIIEYCNE